MDFPEDRPIELSHEEFSNLYNQGRVLVHIDKEKARKVCCDPLCVPSSLIRFYLSFLGLLGMLLGVGALVGTLISLFFIKWYFSLLVFCACSFSGNIVSKIIYSLATRVVLGLIRRDSLFYHSLHSFGVFSFEMKKGKV